MTSSVISYVLAPTLSLSISQSFISICARTRKIKFSPSRCVSPSVLSSPWSCSRSDVSRPTHTLLTRERTSSTDRLLRERHSSTLSSTWSEMRRTSRRDSTQHRSWGSGALSRAVTTSSPGAFVQQCRCALERKIVSLRVRQASEESETSRPHHVTFAFSSTTLFPPSSLRAQ
jgi:hypothetical protein